jgi:hypothetical protein
VLREPLPWWCDRRRNRCRAVRIVKKAFFSLLGSELTRNR